MTWQTNRLPKRRIGRSMPIVSCRGWRYHEAWWYSDPGQPEFACDLQVYKGDGLSALTVSQPCKASFVNALTFAIKLIP